MLRHDGPTVSPRRSGCRLIVGVPHVLLKNGHVTAVTVALMLLDGVPPGPGASTISVNAKPVTVGGFRGVASDVRMSDQSHRR